MAVLDRFGAATRLQPIVVLTLVLGALGGRLRTTIATIPSAKRFAWRHRLDRRHRDECLITMSRDLGYRSRIKTSRRCVTLVHEAGDIRGLPGNWPGRIRKPERTDCYVHREGFSRGCRRKI